MLSKGEEEERKFDQEKRQDDEKTRKETNPIPEYLSLTFVIKSSIRGLKKRLQQIACHFKIGGWVQKIENESQLLVNGQIYGLSKTVWDCYNVMWKEVISEKREENLEIMKIIEETILSKETIASYPRTFQILETNPSLQRKNWFGKVDSSGEQEETTKADFDYETNQSFSYNTSFLQKIKKDLSKLSSEKMKNTVLDDCSMKLFGKHFSQLTTPKSELNFDEMFTMNLQFPSISSFQLDFPKDQKKFKDVLKKFMASIYRDKNIDVEKLSFYRIQPKGEGLKWIPICDKEYPKENELIFVFHEDFLDEKLVKFLESLHKLAALGPILAYFGICEFGDLVEVLQNEERKVMIANFSFRVLVPWKTIQERITTFK